MITLLAYMADFAVLIAYTAIMSGRYKVLLFHWANALGCFPIIASEVAVHAWPPMVLTVAFGAIGWAGVIRTGWNA